MLLLRRDNIDRALQIFRDKCFYSPWELGERDGGMNFLGIQGEQKVHELHFRTATLLFEWQGDISPPMREKDYPNVKPNILYDFNGSGNHFPDPEPRYLLPIGSKGLILKSIQIDNEDYLLHTWKVRHPNWRNKFLWLPCVKNDILNQAWHELYEINQYLRTNKFVIDIRYRAA